MDHLTKSRLESLLQAFPLQTIGLIGDLFLDRYFHIDPELDEVSIETDLTAYQVTEVRNQPGALGTVMSNLAALGVGRLIPFTVIGDDGLGRDLELAMKELPVSHEGIIRDAARLTPTYIKPLRANSDGTFRELNRLDIRTRTPLRDATLERLIEQIESAWDALDGWIVLDQIDQADCGVVHSRVRNVVESLSRRDVRRVVVIDSRSQLGAFRAGMLKGNEREFRLAAGAAVSDVHDAVRVLADRVNRTAFCTWGASGILVGHPGGGVAHVEGVSVEGPIDIVGAGDSATAALTASSIAGAGPEEAAALANLVASITVQQLGTTGTATPEQVLARYDELTGTTN